MKQANWQEDQYYVFGCLICGVVAAFIAFYNINNQIDSLKEELKLIKSQINVEKKEIEK